MKGSTYESIKHCFQHDNHHSSSQFQKKIYRNDKLHFVTGDGFFQIVTMPPAAAVCSFGVFFAFFGVLSTWLLLTQLSSKGGLNGLFSVFFFLVGGGSLVGGVPSHSLVLETIFSLSCGGH